MLTASGVATVQNVLKSLTKTGIPGIGSKIKLGWR
jgi:hypothetical protein